jgi:hypothetical protein
MILYKYLGDYAIGVLASRLVRFTPVLAFNDPFESAYAIASVLRRGEIEASVDAALDQLRVRLTGVLPDSDLDPIFGTGRDRGLRRLHDLDSRLAAILREGVPTLFGALGILSLSERPDSLLMWAHYANRHEGLAVGLDSSHIWFQGDPSAERPLPVRKMRYSALRPSGSVKDFVPFDDYLLWKSAEWQYEAEWRYVQLLSNASTVTTVGEERIHLFELPPELIAEVVVGVRMKPADRARVSEVLAAPEYRHVQLREATLHPSEYSLRIETVVSTGRQWRNGTCA